MTDPELGSYVKKSLVEVPVVESSDSALGELLKLLGFFSLKFDDGDFKFCLVVGFFCLNALLQCPILKLDDSEIKNWFDVTKKYAVWKGLEMYANGDVIVSSFLNPLIAKEKTLWKNEILKKWECFAKTDEFRIFVQLELALWQIKEYSIVEVPDFRRDESERSGDFDLHCEIKLFKYLQHQGLETAHLKFYISRPCCGVCTCYFFGCVTERRPKLIAASLHYCSQVITAGVEEDTRKLLIKLKS